MSWRVAQSLETLRHQLDARYPGRSTASDGSIGDAAHQAQGSASDHNPWYGPGIVTARDFTHDPAHGLDIQELADHLLASRDPRIKYLIANRRIATRTTWQWGPYGGANPHDKHVHLSVVADPLCDDPGEWSLPEGGGQPDGGQPDGDGVRFVTWGTQVNVREQPRLGAPVVAVLPGPTQVTVRCQTRGDTVSVDGVGTNDAWSFLAGFDGYVSNLFIDHPDAWLPGVGEC